ncbi:cell-cell cohesion protein MtsF [Hyalangium rubrum]|uniref:Cell-cell cohesion protein MtsF n=1 Tax=Hyalangium rubrum TaxID=3103134 RepID=A0ABU5GZS0_9BACT|nr:cell-cell cohesion protein MtsF [Hyalangium sp. s54d21]MDY7226531.1 cell-cell cohesion protein MtsF [Hyalangium sp. s54d21]
MLKPAYLLPLALLLLTACPSDGDDDTPDAGGELPPDLCNNPAEALSMPECELVLGQEVERFISAPNDQDWYSVRIPANANARTLVRVTAGYRVPSTAVNLAVGVLRENETALARQVDQHGQGAPRPVEIILPFSEPNARLLLLLGDEPALISRPNFDARAPYFVKVDVLENPDANEPNDTPEQATALTLAPQNGVEVATQSGFLSTGGDVDRFSFTVPAGKIAYVRLSAPELTPPSAYRLSYVLVRPDGTAEDEGVVANTRLAVDLATARKVRSAGPWTVLVRGYRPPNETGTIPGDLRLQYQLEVRVMDEQDAQDTNNDNNSYERPVVRTIGGAPGATTSFTGRLGSVPDTDWYGVDVPVFDKPSVLYYRLVPGTGGGRFPPLPGLVDRQVNVLTQVSAGTVEDSRVACATNAQVCPKGYGEVPAARSLVESFCGGTVPLCLQSAREEDSNFPNLRNFEGAIPVPAHGATARYLFGVQDTGNNWADDRDYVLQVTWLADQDDADRAPTGTEQPTPLTFANDTNGTTFPVPPGNATALNGVLTHGFGRLQADDRTTGRGVRGPRDYDAVPSDVDSYLLSIEGSQPAPQDRAWALQWTVQHLPDGGMPHGLALDLTFCDGDRMDSGVCTPVSTGSRNSPLTLAYRGEPLRAWHTPSGTLSGLQPLYSRQVVGNSTVFTVQPYACSCLEPRFVRGGTVRVDVSATERESYERVNYSVRTAYTAYPQSYATDGGMRMCPAPQQDGGTALPDGGTSPTTWAPGCRFTVQP